MNKFNENPSKKKLNLSKTFIAIICVLIGISGTLLAQNISQKHHKNLWQKNLRQEGILRLHSDFFFDDFFLDDSDFFKEMSATKEVFEKHRKSMNKAFEQMDKSDANQSKTSVSTKEDDKFFYYELSFAGFKKDEVLAEVKDGELKFSGESKTDEKNTKSHQNFLYSFSTPQTKAKKEPEIIKQDNKIIVKFSK
jgi:HSP20 family molecular chaperone IbpA